MRAPFYVLYLMQANVLTDQLFVDMNLYTKNETASAKDLEDHDAIIQQVKDVLLAWDTVLSI